MNTPPAPGTPVPKEAWFDKLLSRLRKAQKVEKGRWYVVGAGLAALLVFILALSTTVLAEQRLRQDAISNTRAELRSVLQRLYGFPLEEARMRLQPSAAGGALQPGVVSDYLVTEQHMLIRHAAELLDELKELKGRVYSMESGMVASGLLAQGDFERAEQLLEEVLRDKQNLLDEVIALRGLAAVSYVRGDFAKGRELFQRTIQETTQRSPSPVYANLTNAETYLLWTQAELSQAECLPALQQWQAGIQIVAALKPGVREGMMKQFGRLGGPFRAACPSIQLPPGVGGSGVR
ncbi:tetratricopeptide repeat protein [Archangium gephyra]|nr:tetratricopeptide repeat protein [Archangium gephyra]